MSVKIIDWLGLSLNTGKENYITIWKYTFLFMVTGILATVCFIGVVFVPAIVTAYRRALYLIVKNEPVSFKACLKFGFEDGMWWRSICFSVLKLIILVPGFLLFTIPGVCFTVVLYFADTSFVSKKKGVFEAFAHSSAMLKEVGFGKIFALITIVGMLKLVFGILALLGIPVFIFLTPFFSVIPFVAFLQIEEARKIS